MRRIRNLLAILIVIIATAGAAKADTLDTLAAGGAGGWLNTEQPVTRAQMEGRLILLDFWTYGCVNCMQIIPDLEALEHQFGDKLLIIGVHSAKFKGEQGSRRILAAAQRFGLKHPVINDSDFAIWKSMAVNAWPTQVLLGADGQEIARYTGEGHRAEIAAAIDKNIGSVKTTTPAPVLAKNAKETSPLWFPARIVKAGGMFYIADSGHDRIIGITADGKITAVIGAGVRGLKDGDFKTAQFNAPRGMDVQGDIMLVADTGNHALREVNLKTGQVTTLAGDGTRGSDYTVQDKKAGDVQLASPWDVKFDPDPAHHRAVIAMAGLHQLWSYDLVKNTLSVIAGSGYEGLSDGVANDAKLAQPSALSFGKDGTLYFADAESSAIRALKGEEVTTLIGTGLFDFGLVDGKYPTALLQHAQGLAVRENKIYIADTYNNAMRVYDLVAQELSTLKGRGEPFAEPGDILADENAVYIVDTNNHVIKKRDSVTDKITTLMLTR
ncbi:MAG: thioredoxin-like domain-containing protein [Pseudobdellovibrionaceae bacterium]